MILGKQSAGATPVAGASITAMSPALDVYYPNDTFAGPGAATATHGIFIAVPKTASPVVTIWTVNKPAGDAREWDMPTAGTNPGNAYVLLAVAKE
jgi:hypothetical protein